MFQKKPHHTLNLFTGDINAADKDWDAEDLEAIENLRANIKTLRRSTDQRHSKCKRLTRQQEEVEDVLQQQKALLLSELNALKTLEKDLARAIEAKANVKVKALALAKALAKAKNKKVADVPADANNDCAICQDAEVKDPFTPCGHLMCCAACASAVLSGKKLCPICNVPVTGVFHIFKC